jgi:hypothetical protein
MDFTRRTNLRNVAAALMQCKGIDIPGMAIRYSSFTHVG